MNSIIYGPIWAGYFVPTPPYLIIFKGFPIFQENWEGPQPAILAIPYSPWWAIADSPTKLPISPWAGPIGINDVAQLGDDEALLGYSVACLGMA